MKTQDLISEVASGKSAEEVLEKAITRAGYDPRSPQNKQTTVWADVDTDDDIEEDEEDGDEMTHDNPETINYPLAGARKWPRGSHESPPPEGEAARVREPSVAESMIESVVKGIDARRVVKGVEVYELEEADGSVAAPAGFKTQMTKLESDLEKWADRLFEMNVSFKSNVSEIKKLMKQVTSALDAGKISTTKFLDLSDRIYSLSTGEVAKDMKDVGKLGNEWTKIQERFKKMAPVIKQMHKMANA